MAAILKSLWRLNRWQKEQQLKELMIYAGRPGLWRDYEKFCNEARYGRAKAKRQAQRRRAQMMERSVFGVVGLFLASIIGIMIYVVLILKDTAR